MMIYNKNNENCEFFTLYLRDSSRSGDQIGDFFSTSYSMTEGPR